MPGYRLFGHTLESDFPFTAPLPESKGEATLTFTCREGPGFLPAMREEAPLYEDPSVLEGGESILRLYQLPEGDLLSFTGVADFLVGGDAVRCLPAPATDIRMVEILFLGAVMAYWLELRGIKALHASAVAVGDRAVAFLSSNGGGKSSLAAAMMKTGCPLVTDDLLAVEFRNGFYSGKPGYPQMRMWPREAEFFLGGGWGLPEVHPATEKRLVPVGPKGFGRFDQRTRALASVYLPELLKSRKGDEGIAIIPLTPREGTLELLRYSFSPRLFEGAGMAAPRLDFFSRLALRVPLRRLLLAPGPRHLSQVRRAIEEDLAGLDPNPVPA